MILIIDGYNLLKQIMKAKFASEQQLKWLISKLVAYSKIKGHKIIIVFDGEDQFFLKFKETQVKIIFSGKYISADKYINSYVEQNKSPDLIVISSDRFISSFASKHNIACIDSIIFYQKLNQTIEPSQGFASVSPQESIYMKKSTGQASKLAESSSNPELDKLMQEASEYIMIKDEGEASASPASQRDTGHKIVKSKTLSKQEKRLLNILKKL